MNKKIYLISTTLYLRGELLIPQKITEKLKVEPTKAYQKGDLMLLHSSDKKSFRRIGIWTIEEVGKSNSTKMVSEQLNNILGKLELWDPIIIQECFIEDYYIDIYIAVNCKDVFKGSCTFFLNRNDINLLNAFNFPVNVTVDMVQEEPGRLG